MIEIQFDVAGTRLRGHFHHPARTGAEQAPGVVIIPGFADTAVGPHNLHRALADALAQSGLAVVRFDYRGQGESDGDFRAFTAASGLEDARGALNWLNQQAGIDSARLGLSGFSLGGALACVLAAQTPAIRALTLLAPVAYPQKVFRSFFTDQHLAQAAEQGWSDWLGWPVGSAFLASTAALDPLRAIQASNAQTLVIQGSADSEVPPENGLAYAQQGASLVWLEGGDHQFSSVLLQEKGIQHASDWFQRHLAAT
jgi:alpha/beta superfamily hydrolase